jgi:isochorismate pyruvate lyase
LTADECKDLADVRTNIDMLDRLIVPLLVQRSTYVARAGQLKVNRAQVVDPARIEDVVSKVRAIAEDLGGNHALIETLYRGVISAFIAFETGVWDDSHG